MTHRVGNSTPVHPPFTEIVLQVVDHLDAMVAYWDARQVCVFANAAYHTWFGRTRDQMIGITLKELLGPIYEKNLPYINAALAGAVQVFEREIPTPNGHVRHSLATYTPHLVDGEVRGIFVHVADVTPLKKLENELRIAKAKAEQLATHDFLTGLPNRVLLHDRISRALALARRTNRMVAVVSLDVDNFKHINDSYGHSAGDQLLVEVAARLQRFIRKSDSATRMGGDEFLLLIPDVESKSQIQSLVERLQVQAKSPVTLASTSIEPSFSLGIALCAGDEAMSPEALIEESDRALFNAKKLGKNRFVFSQHAGFQ